MVTREVIVQATFLNGMYVVVAWLRHDGIYHHSDAVNARVLLRDTVEALINGRDWATDPNRPSYDTMAQAIFRLDEVNAVEVTCPTYTGCQQHRKGVLLRKIR